MNEGNNPLGYYKGNAMWGRRARVCLPNRERETFIESLAVLKLDKITIRGYNRYIDEFLRYTNEVHKTADIKKITPEMVGAYKLHLGRQPKINESTKSLKINTIKKWCLWLEENKVIKKSPFAS